MRVDCPGCGQPVPLNAPSQSAHCAACARDFAVPPAIFAAVLLRFDDARPALVKSLKGIDTTVGELSVHAAYHSDAPKCEKCGHELTVPFPCASCGDSAACYPAPDWLRTVVPNATHVAVSDTTAIPSAVASRPRHDESRPVLMPCPGCGASLKLTSDTTRTLQCAFCKNDVYLPDDLWRRLHPVRIMAPWFVRFEGISRGEAERMAEEAEAEEVARRRAVEDDLRVEANVELGAVKAADAASKATQGKVALVLVVLAVVVLVCVFGAAFALHKC